MSHRLSFAVVSLLTPLLFGPGVQAASLSMAWETPAEFSNPESVVHDPATGSLYVSNVNGSPVEKDDNGFISKMSMSGEIVELQWVDGLNAPKGMAIQGDSLYVSDITRIVRISIGSGEVADTYEVEGAKFLNDVAVDRDGIVYVSDMFTNKIYKLVDGHVLLWIDDEALENPNGLMIENDNVIVGSWGKMDEQGNTKVPGHLKSVSIGDGSISTLGNGNPVGNLDGVEPDGNGNYFVSDWVAGALYHIKPDGSHETLLDLNQGSADIGLVAEKNLMFIPMMKDNKVIAYKISK